MQFRRSTNTSSASASSTSTNNVFVFVFVIVFPVYLQVFDHPQDVTQEELQQDLLLLPEWRRQNASSYRFLIDQVLCAKAYLLLKNGLKEVYDITGNPVFEYVKHEKPVLRDYPDIHFNLSHCRRGIMCVIDDMPIGCDIEEIESTLTSTCVMSALMTTRWPESPPIGLRLKGRDFLRSQTAKHTCQ